MPRNGSGVYSLPAGLPANGETSNATDDILTPFGDLETDMNTARPIVAGGTGATSASAARTNLEVVVYSTRTAANAAALAALANGTIGVMSGNTYEVDSTVTGSASCTNDLSVDGLKPYGPATPEHYGAVGDGTTDDASAFNAALANHVVLVCRDRTYLFNSQLTSSQEVVLVGQGISATQLYWPSGATTVGISITAGSGEYPVEVRDLALVSGKATVTGSALAVDMTAQASGGSVAPRTAPRLTVSNVSIRGLTDVSTDGWDKGVDCVDVMHALIDGVHFEGKKTGTASDSTTAFEFSGANNPVEIIITNSWAFWASTAAAFTDIEGAYIHACNFVACEKGVTFGGSAAEPQLNVQNTHINMYTTGIEIANCNQFNLSNCLIYTRTDATGSLIGIDIASTCANGIISDNVFIENGGALDCIDVDGDKVQIYGNSFSGERGVDIETNATNTRIGADNYYVSIASDKVRDSSTAGTSWIEFFPSYAGNINNVLTTTEGPQTHRLVTGATNVPSGATANGSVLNTFGWDGNTGYQMLWPPQQAEPYWRIKASGTWGTWRQFGRREYETSSAASIADATNAINTTNKRIGRHVYDTTNNRLMIADGSNATDPWYVADGSASVTPA